MGSGHSQEDYEGSALMYYENALQSQCILPNVGIDAEILKYSGTNSNAALLQTFSNELANNVPGFIEKLGSSLAPMTSVPNAVGIGALVISMIIEICMKGATQDNADSYSMLRRVFGEEKGSAVRDTMSEYLWRHRLFMNNDQRIREELRRLEQQLNSHLIILRNSLLHDGQMSTRGFKIWVNGASFHLQMLIHEARLNIKIGKPASEYVNVIEGAITLYLRDLDNLLDKYKTYKTSTTSFRLYTYTCLSHGCPPPICYMTDDETHCEISIKLSIMPGPCSGSEITEGYMNRVFSQYEPISSLKSHFSDIKNNLNSSIHQHGSFNLPSTRTMSVGAVYY